jgi:hypothetical protein
MIDLRARPTAHRSRSRPPSRVSAQQRGGERRCRGNPAASGGDGEERGRCRAGGGSRFEEEKTTMEFIIFPFSRTELFVSFVFTWGRMPAVGSGKSADNMCAFLSIVIGCVDVLYRRTIWLVWGLDSCTLLNASSLRRLSSFRLKSHGMV